MRIGINGSSQIALAAPIDRLVADAVQAEADGFSTYWVAQLGWPDALTALALVGQSTSSIELGTAVIATWPRHPLMLAAQALTAQSVTESPLLVGIGLAHKSSVEGTYRVPFARPAEHMREYLDVLLPALSERKVSARGTDWSAEVEHLATPPGVKTPKVALAAMGPRMLELAGSRTEGTILWLAGPRGIGEHLAPAMTSAAAAAGRRDPRIVASVPVCVTDDADRVRGTVAAVLDGYNELPSYRGVMDREGVGGPADVSVIGDEQTVRAGIESFASAGTTDFSALEFVSNDDEARRTRELLKSLL